MERQRMSAIVSFIVASGIVIAGILGPLFTGVIRFHLPDLAVNQYVGGEIVTVFIAAPALVIAGALWLRHDQLAPVIAFGPASYAVYTFITAIVGQEYARFDGNAERAFFLYAGIISGGLFVLTSAAADLLRMDVPRPTRRLRIVTAGLFLTIALFFAIAWGGQIAQLYRGIQSPEYLQSPGLFWLIKLMDVSVLLPLFAVTGIALIRRHPLAIRFTYGMVCYAVCMVAAILGMAIAMQLRHDPAASAVMVAFLVPVTIAFTILAWRWLDLVRQRQESVKDRPNTLSALGHGHAG